MKLLRSTVNTSNNETKSRNISVYLLADGAVCMFPELWINKTELKKAEKRGRQRKIKLKKEEAEVHGDCLDNERQEVSQFPIFTLDRNK